ncbi:MAG: hypothetical protein IJ809_02380 [Clostridia bacterium]|nr:hypothetical protein [Clostridia bacterium]
MYIINAKLLIPIAFIHSLEERQKSKLLFSNIIKYGNSVVKQLNSEGIGIVLFLYRNATNAFFEEYKDWFYGYTIEDKNFLILSDNITSNMLRNEFGCLLSLDLITAFSNTENIKVLFE